jgi:ADP-ribose pyrophosphatase YjhB (NUDIX family)
MWELPGGKLELREDPADCVVREIREEVITSDPDDIAAIDPTLMLARPT